MSVRRLAEVTLQPPSFSFDRAFAAQAEKWVAKYPEGRQQSAIIPLLMLAQEQDGWVTKAAIESIADMLRMPYIRALEVATFYTQFQLKPVGTKAHVQVCGTTPCMLRGSEALMDVCRSKIHHDQFHLNEAGTLSWEEVECLGACVNAPMVMIWKDAYEDLTPERLAEIIDAFETGQGAGVPVGPQNGRIVSTPASGQTTLLDETIFLDAARKRREQEKAGETGPGGTGETTVPPSKAARPATDAKETNPAIKTPSPEKAPKTGTEAAQSEAPPFDQKAADKAEPAVEGTDKERSRPRRGAEEQVGAKAPEYAARPKAGESGDTIAGAPVAPDRPEPGQVREAEGADALGSSLGGGVRVAQGVDASAPGSVSHAGGQFVVGVSDSNTPRPGDEQLRPERDGGYAGPVEGVSLEDPDRPPNMTAPATRDDLQLISGIGPRIDGKLRDIGIHTFSQIGGWTDAQAKWIDRYLGLNGRIERDNWLGQAQALATGGEEEYVRVFGRKPR